MNFKEVTYVTDKGKVSENYEKTGLSKKVEELINTYIGDIKKDIQTKIDENLYNFIEKNELHIDNLRKLKYSTNVKNIYDMKCKDFSLIADEIKDSLIERIAIEELIRNKKISIKEEIATLKLSTSNADIEIDINYDCENEKGNKLVYIYDLYFSGVYRLENS